jgi:2-amino-4-hydroxy-6-hydroxymethyldihydropteridine diphosphokinase
LKTVYLGLGSNLGDRAANLAAARERLAPIKRASSIYETEPREMPNQPWFLNQVIEIETDLFPKQLLARTQKIERDLGRKRTVDKGPRTIDIDILLFGESVIHTAELEIPHPRLAERRFVLEPLAEIAPDLRIRNIPIRDLLAMVATQSVRRL